MVELRDDSGERLQLRGRLDGNPVKSEFGPGEPHSTSCGFCVRHCRGCCGRDLGRRCIKALEGRLNGHRGRDA